jgi:hypothetical protein
MPTAQLEGKIRLGQVIVAEDESHTPLGYCIGNDQYFKHDDVGIIYQLNVVPERRRALVGAALVRAMFERAAYGCRLFCCWCAQDIEANYFWESIGFVPLAFRTGSRSKGKNSSPRVHIFWEKRIREGDTTTPWWFPTQTSSGAIREDRLVLPIPPGTYWSDAKPVILPGHSTAALPTPRKKVEKPKPQVDPHDIAIGGLRAAPIQVTTSKGPKAPRAKHKNDPRFVAAARELRDKYLEQVNAGLIALPVSAARYLVCKTSASSPLLQETSVAPIHATQPARLLHAA